MGLERSLAQELNNRSIDACTDIEELKKVTKSLLAMHEGYRATTGELLKDVVRREVAANLSTQSENSDMVAHVISRLPQEARPGPEFWED